MSDELLSRRRLIKTLAAGAAATMCSRRGLAAGMQSQSPPREPPSTITNPPRDFGPNAPPAIYPDPDIIAVDPAFNA